VIDREKQVVAAVWPLTCKINASVAIDEKKIIGSLPRAAMAT